jgi:predicted phosphodiesterase
MKRHEVQLPNLDKKRSRIVLPDDDVRLVFFSDTHFGSKYCAEEKVAQAVKDINKYKPDAIFFEGDLVDGSHVYQGQEYELKAQSLPEQLELARNVLEPLKGNIYAIDGNHSADFVKRGAGYPQQIFSEMLPNWQYSGIYHGGYSLVQDSKSHDAGIRLDMMHPNGGNCYAISYSAQRVLRNLPFTTDLLALGHFHQTGYFQIPNNGTYTHSMLVPSFQESTPYAQRHGWVSSYIGYITLEFKRVGNLIKDLSFQLHEMI